MFILLAFHINELIEQRDIAYKDLCEHMKKVYELVGIWNDHKLCLWYDLVIQSYEASFIEEECIANLELKIKEYSCVASYYKKINHRIMNEASNILELQQAQTEIVKSKQSYVDDLKQKMYAWRECDENFLRDIGVLTYPLITHLQDNAKKFVNNKNKLNLTNAKKRKDSMKDIQQSLLEQSNVIAAGGAPDPDDDEDEFLEKLIENSDKEALVKRFGKFYRDPKTKYWWSKDRAFHGGYHYKVYKETAKGLEWILNADLKGI